MDLGGTNLRVMIMHIEPGEPMRTKQFNTRIPDKAMHGSGKQVDSYYRIIFPPTFLLSSKIQYRKKYWNNSEF